MVPVSDVDVECAKLFGPDIKLEHKSFGDLNITYTLNTESNVYEIPIAAQVGYYTPKVEKISKKGDTYTLTVGYLPPGNAWTSDLSGTKYEPTPDKYMLYVMKKVKGGYNLVAIRLQHAVHGLPFQMIHISLHHAKILPQDSLVAIFHIVDVYKRQIPSSASTPCSNG